MSKPLAFVLALAGSVFSFTTTAQEPGVVKPDMVLKRVVEGMPKGDTQEVAVMTATFKPGDRTVFHKHRFPVTVYVLAGAFTLEQEGRSPLAVTAGEAYLEPPNVAMTGYNRSETEPLKVLIFYVGEPDTPFLDIIH